MEKYCGTGQAKDDTMAHALCMLDTKGYKHTLRICNAYCCYTATTVERARLNVTLYRVILSVLDPRKCEYFKDYSLDFEHAYMTTYLAS